MMGAIMNIAEKAPICASAEPGAETSTAPSIVAHSRANTPMEKTKTFSLRPFVAGILPPILGVIFLVLVWEGISARNSGIPSPLTTFKAALILFADPFYSNGPNDQGIGW